VAAAAAAAMEGADCAAIFGLGRGGDQICSRVEGWTNVNSACRYLFCVVYWRRVGCFCAWPVHG
jgi:hypothetical protein